jgi:Tol biopolymer transport system component
MENPPSGENGRIVFARAASRFSEGAFVTYTANPDGSDERQLPAGASFQPKPRWSPDGSKIAVTEPKTATSECPNGVTCTAIVVNVDTGGFYGVPWLMPGTWDVDCFPWSPDGTRLACGALDDNGTNLSGIYTIRASDGGDPKRITPCNECVPGDFSPDGRRLVFADTDQHGNVGIFVVRLNGSGLHRVTPQGMSLNNADGGSWSPMANQIVFQARSAPDQAWTIWVVNADGSGLRQIPISACGGSTSDTDAAACRLPAWSPDGMKILFSRRAPAQTSVAGIYEVNADGSGLVRITNNGLGDNQPDWGTHPTS